MLLAQIDAEQAAHLPPTLVDLVEVAADVVAQLAPAALADGKTIELCGEGKDAILGRREAVAAALRNLIENALRVTPQGVPVVVRADQSGELAVRDGGAGLSPERLDVLVRRLRRADHASTNGAGLGLAIVARIMAAHGGRLVTDPGQRELRLIFPSA
jgi:signal transduction histidine kinase